MQSAARNDRTCGLMGTVRKQACAADRASQREGWRALRLGAAALLALPLLLLVQPAGAVAAAQPVSVTVAGDFQSELGCPGDWTPDCAASQLTYDRLMMSGRPHGFCRPGSGSTRWP